MMTSMITPLDARRLLSETIKGSPRIQHPDAIIEHAEFIADLVQETIDNIRYTGIDFPVNDLEMESAAILHDIGYCFAENSYLHPHVGGDFLRKRGFPRIGKIIETHTYAPEAVALLGYKDVKDPHHWIPTLWNQVLIDYASLHAGMPHERITPNEKFRRFRTKRDGTFRELIELAEPRLRKEIGEIDSLLKWDTKTKTISAYNFLNIGGEFK